MTEQITRLTGRLVPSPLIYRPELWPTARQVFDNAGFGGYITHDDTHTGELVFDFAGDGHSNFTAGDGGFADTLANVLTEVREIYYSGNLCLNTTLRSSTEIITAEIAVIDSQVFTVRNNILHPVSTTIHTSPKTKAY